MEHDEKIICPVGHETHRIQFELHYLGPVSGYLVATWGDARSAHAERRAPATLVCAECGIHFMDGVAVKTAVASLTAGRSVAEATTAP